MEPSRADSPRESVQRRTDARILVIRGRRVLLDADLARLYGTTAKRLREQVRRNQDRFPEDFCFRISRGELEEVAANCGYLRNLRYARGLPLAFTEHGAIMAASVVHTSRAVEMSVFVVRAFVRMRGLLAAHEGLAAKLEELERRVGAHDDALRDLVAAIRRLLEPPPATSAGKIGFRPA
jgi:ORF6N domain-containing protein